VKKNIKKLRMTEPLTLPTATELAKTKSKETQAMKTQFPT
jgi:hypothetical protein